MVESLKLVERTQRMYNLTVDAAHTYFVGDGQWLVHNSCADVAVIGRQSKTEKYLRQEGYEALNDPNWDLSVNDAWAQGIIDRRAKVFLAIDPDAPGALWNARRQEPAVILRAFSQVLGAGYTRQGDCLLPPGGTP